MTKKLFLKRRDGRAVHWLMLPVMILGFVCSADNFGNYVVTDFSAVVENHKPPHETQVKTLLRGSRAEPLPGGLTVISNAELRSFSETGDLQLLIQAPQCVFTPVRGAGPVHYTVSSSGLFTAQSGDGRFVFEGVGFLWQQTNNVLNISNRVQTVIRSELKKAPKK